jgi:hypothetical protein
MLPTRSSASQSHGDHRLVGDIDVALGSVNSTVSQMRQSTQQNAAMAEEANAAAESTKQQIDRLEESISEFNLADIAPRGEADRARFACVRAQGDKWVSVLAPNHVIY